MQRQCKVSCLHTSYHSALSRTLPARAETGELCPPFPPILSSPLAQPLELLAFLGVQHYILPKTDPFLFPTPTCTRSGLGNGTAPRALGLFGIWRWSKFTLELGFQDGLFDFFFLLFLLGLFLVGNVGAGWRFWAVFELELFAVFGADEDGDVFVVFFVFVFVFVFCFVVVFVILLIFVIVLILVVRRGKRRGIIIIQNDLPR